MRTITGFVLGAVIGAGATAFGLSLLSEESASGKESGETRRDAGSHHDDPTRPPSLRSASRAGDGTAREAAPGDTVAFDRASFDRHFQRRFREATGVPPSADEARRAWQQARALMTQSATQATAEAVRRHAQRAREAMLVEREDVIALLADPDRADTLITIRSDARALEGLFAHRQSGPRLPGHEALRAEDPRIAAGTTLEFPAGVWTVDTDRLLTASRELPIDLTIEGAGMNHTLIRFDGVHSQSIVWNFHLRDCTIDCGNGVLFDLRSEKAGVRAEGVRFVRFDAGHALSCVFYLLGGGAVYCCDCTFAGGYGKAPGQGRVITGTKLARFERCLFDRIDLNVYEPSITLYGCTFRDCAGAAREIELAADSPPDRASFVDCRVESTLPPGKARDADTLRRDLGELFPGVR